MATEHPTPPTTYAYVSIGQYQNTLEIFSKTRPERIDQNFLVKYGIPSGSTFSVLSALRFLNIIDENGNVLEPQMLVRLGNQQERASAQREIVETAYADLIRQHDIEQATVADVDMFFQYQGMSPNVSIKAARFFMWLAKEAGFKVGEDVQPQSRSQIRPSTPTARRDYPRITTKAPQSAQAPEPAIASERPQQYSFTEYERELLQILLTNLKESKQVPDSDTLRQLRELIAAVKGESPSD